MTLASGAPLDVITTRLARAGWGDLGTPTLRGLARVLECLAGSLNAKTGAGKITAPQIAERICYTERWVRRCLRLLEEAEIIEWDRGGIVAGKPVPSWIRVSKAALVDLVHIARTKQTSEHAERSKATRRRLARLRSSYTRRPGKQPQDRKRPARASAEPHAELPTALLFNKEVSTADNVAADGGKDKKDDAPASRDYARRAVTQIRADLAARRRATRGKAAARTEIVPGPSRLPESPTRPVNTYA